MKSNEARINFLPAPTWNFLRMNYSDVSDVGFNTSAECHVSVPEGVTYKKADSFKIEKRTGLGNDMSILTEDNAAYVDSYTVKKGKSVEEPLRQVYFFGKEPTVNAVEIVSEEGSECTVIMDFFSEEIKGRAIYDAGIQTRYEVKNNASLTLVTIQRLGDNHRFFNDIGGSVAENGKFKLIQLVLSGKETYMGCFSSLYERKADFTSRIAYLLKDDDKLDMNYVSDHTGRKTTCDIKVSGVLRDKSNKTFRGTIDFHKGCKGSTGAELEDVLLMDRTVHNKTIPLILCDEEDVEGAHGATIGRVNENEMFYLKSRGIPEEKIYEMMAQAKVKSALSDIEDDFTSCSVARTLIGK